MSVIFHLETHQNLKLSVFKESALNGEADEPVGVDVTRSQAVARIADRTASQHL